MCRFANTFNVGEEILLTINESTFTCANCNTNEPTGLSQTSTRIVVTYKGHVVRNGVLCDVFEPTVHFSCAKCGHKDLSLLVACNDALPV